MALIVYFRLESYLLADKISTSQNNGITDLLSFHFIALVYVPLVFTNSETSENRLIIQLINIVMNNKSTQNSQENVILHSFIEFSIFHAIFQ